MRTMKTLFKIASMIIDFLNKYDDDHYYILEQESCTIDDMEVYDDESEV